MKLVTRGQWGARPPKNITRLTGATTVTDHWEGPKMGSFPHERCAALVKGIQNYHMDHNGWADLAYNAIVCPHGWIFEGRWIGVRSAANGTNAGNGASYAVCGLRGEGDPFTDEMKQGFAEAHAFFGARLVVPHSKWLSTSCPGDDQRAWIAAGCPVPQVAPPSIYTPDDPVPSTSIVAATDYGDGSYFMFGADGGVFAVNTSFVGSLANVRLNAPIVWGAGLPDKSGYYMVGADGGIFAFGSARPIAPYQALFGEYARGERKITTASLTPSGLLLVSNLGERYAMN